MVGMMAAKNLDKQTKGKYPAPYQALDVTLKSVEAPHGKVCVPLPLVLMLRSSLALAVCFSRESAISGQALNSSILWVMTVGTG